VSAGEFEFFRKGWLRFRHDPYVAGWAEKARPVAGETLDDPDLRRLWLRCGGTWFAGVNALANGPDGGLAARSIPPLKGPAVDFIAQTLGFSEFAWDRAQVSICFPGYPRRGEGEIDAVFHFRRDRDAAHVDGLRRTDPGRRRNLDETHGFILGLPLSDAPAGAAPFVVYEGSHEIVRAALKDRLAGIAPTGWAAEDITEAYVAARRRCFLTCPRVTLPARPGESYIVHRLCLHGVAPWAGDAVAGRRMIAYFRPDPLPGASPEWWLERP